MTTTPTVIEYVLGRLNDIGVTDIFGVPGDFAFPVQDAIVGIPISTGSAAVTNSTPPTRPTDTARVRGIAALSTTYGVGELGAISGVAGSYAENLPVFT